MPEDKAKANPAEWDVGVPGTSHLAQTHLDILAGQANEIAGLRTGLNIASRIERLDRHAFEIERRTETEIHKLDKRLTAVEALALGFEKQMEHIHVHIREIQDVIRTDNGHIKERLAGVLEWLEGHDERDAERMKTLAMRASVAAEQRISESTRALKATIWTAVGLFVGVAGLVSGVIFGIVRLVNGG